MDDRHNQPPRFVDLELSLAQRLEGLDPRSGQGALGAPKKTPPVAEERRGENGSSGKRGVCGIITLDIPRPPPEVRYLDPKKIPKTPFTSGGMTGCLGLDGYPFFGVIKLLGFE